LNSGSALPATTEARMLKHKVKAVVFIVNDRLLAWGAGLGCWSSVPSIEGVDWG
jgi:hypothetical protein